MTQPDGRRWGETCQLFHELSDMTAPERQKRLKHLGSTDPDMRLAVESLLAADNIADEVLSPLRLGITEVLHRNLSASHSPPLDSLRLTGRTVSHFRIIEPLAAGGMGVVYRAYDTRMNREVAFKVPRTVEQLDSQGRSRFLREAHAAGTLDHRNICSIYEVGETDDRHPFMAMALYSGETLKARITRDGPLPTSVALDIAHQVALGLEAAHAAGIIHRDLKPGNIMLLPDGTAKILDFGLAKLTDVTQTGPGAGMGTAGYMSPEQIRGGAVDARTDLWALGVVLHEMLTGVRPFSGEDIASMALASLHNPPPRPSTIRADVTREIDDLTGSLLQKIPAHRYERARDVASDLQAIQLGAKPVFRRRVRHRASAWIRTRPRSAKVALILVASAMIVSIAAGALALAPVIRGNPTRNADAWNFYLRARDYEEKGPLAAADTLYRRALALDSGFALARARLALVYLTYTPRPDQARLEQAKNEAMTALRSKPGLAEAHYALGLYWQRHDDHQRALAEFALARRGLAGTSALHGATGTSYVGLGRWDEAVTAFERALELEPAAIRYAPSLAITYSRLRRYRESQETWSRYIALTPDAYFPMLIKGYSVMRSEGTTDTLAAALRRIPPDWDGNGMATHARVEVARIRRRPAEALAALVSSKPGVSQDNMIFRPHSLFRAMAYANAGDSTAARANYDSAHAMLEDSLRAHPRDPRLHIALGMVMTGLGRKNEAIRSARRAMELAPISANVSFATCFMGGAAEIFAQLGESDAAIELLDRLLRMPAGREVSVPLLRVDPAYDRLRSDPRFQRMLARHDTD